MHRCEACGAPTSRTSPSAPAHETGEPPEQGSAREQHLEAVLAAAGEAILVLDLDGHVLTANPRCGRLFDGRVTVGARLHDLVDTATAEALDRQLVRRAAGQCDRYQLQVQDRAGDAVWLQIAATPLLGGDGAVAGSVAVLTDITAGKHEEQRLHTVASTDPLTGALTRLALTDRIEHSLARRRRGVVAVLFCDVDGLKTTNDELGHAAGDELLRQVASRVRAALRPADTLARYGGDEFVVVCEDLPQVGEAVRLAERVRSAVALPLPEDASDAVPTLSIGVATSPPHRSAEALLAAADGAAYVAKRAGRNTVHLSP